MAVLSVALQVASATMLLLFAVRIVQKGIQSNAGNALRRVFAGPCNTLNSSMVGMLTAMLLQSSAAVTLLTASFVGTGASTVGFQAALATVLGADLGSALIVLALSFQLDWILPACLGLGGWLYLKTKTIKARKAGQVLLGIGIILLSLQMLADAFEPMRNSDFWPAVVGYFNADLLTPFILGAAMAFIIHSSVATILMCVALAEIGAIPLPVGIALTLGANLGSSLIPLWLTRDHPAAARRVVMGNVLLRGTAATLTFFASNWAWPSAAIALGSAGQMLIAVHVGFNAALLITLPLIKHLDPLLLSILPNPPVAADPIAQWRLESCLVPSSHLTPALALANIRRETLRMSQFVSIMARPALAMYQQPATDEHAKVHQKERALHDVLANIRHYSATLPFEEMNKQERSELRELLDTAIDLVAVGDIVASGLGVFAQTVQSQHIIFSDDGWAELVALNNKVIENMTLAFGALAANDTTLARTVVEEKTCIRKLERSSRMHHFDRLRNGEGDSFDSSDIHLETLRTLKELNSKITEIIYPMLSRSGHLLESRLIPEPK